MQIRKAGKNDFEYIYPLVEDVFAKGDTYVFPGNLSRGEVFDIWMKIHKLFMLRLKMVKF